MGRHALRASRLPDPDLVFRPTRRDIDSATWKPTAELLWDRHEWRTHGACWLWCGRDDIEVTWIGPVRSSGLHAALHACRACLYELDQRVLETVMRRDMGGLTVDRDPDRSPKGDRGVARPQ